MCETAQTHDELEQMLGFATREVERQKLKNNKMLHTLGCDIRSKLTTQFDYPVQEEAMEDIGEKMDPLEIANTPDAQTLLTKINQDQNILSLLKKIENIDDSEQIRIDDELVQLLISNHQKFSSDFRKKKKNQEEDAKCAICNSGDYEENDLIIFCGFCEIPVHQSCYGIEKVPQSEWFCLACTVLGKIPGRNL